MPTRIENKVEELVFDVAGELDLTDAQVHRLDVARIGGLALARLRVEVENEARQPQTQKLHGAATGAASSIRRLMVRVREVLVS